MVGTRRSTRLNCAPLRELQPVPKAKRVSTRPKGSALRKREHSLSEDAENSDVVANLSEKIGRSSCSGESDDFSDSVNIKRKGCVPRKRRKRSNKPPSVIDKAIIVEGDCQDSTLTKNLTDNSLLFGREEEYDKLSSSLLKSLSSGTSLSFYISGPPGSGKTATVRKVLDNLTVGGKIKFLSATVNCVTYSNENEVLREICRKLGKSRTVAVSQLQKQIENIFAATKIPIVIVLDEIDGVKTKNNLFYYCAFQWPATFSKVSLIGIANSLDLTVRVLPKLKLVRSPDLLTFSPYNRNVLKEIIKRKLSLEVIGNSDDAIELCSRKVSAMTGDVRTAIHIARQMITQINESNSSNSSTSGLVQLANRITEISVSSAKKARLPLQQKIILATILRVSGILHSSTVKKDSLLQAYSKVCGLLQLPMLNSSELCSALSLLEARMIINYTDTTSYKLLLDTPSIHRIIGDESLITRIINISEEKLLSV
uniref:AAA domain-containing protein n=1 Tax=Syphacia muris TaxID=451379 RepID=A0A0N5ASK2_9BILA